MNAQSPAIVSAGLPSRIPISERRTGIRVVRDDHVFIDNLLTLWEGRMPILIAAVVGAGLGWASTLFLPPTYDMSSVIEIGTIYRPDGEPTLIEQPDSAVTKLVKIHAVEVTRERAQLDDQLVFRFPLEATNPARTNLIILSTRTTTAVAGVHADLQRRVATRLLDAHRIRQERSRAELEVRLAMERGRIASHQAGIARHAEGHRRLVRMLSVIEGKEFPVERGREIRNEESNGSGADPTGGGDMPARPVERVDWTPLFQQHQQILAFEREERSALERCEREMLSLEGCLGLMQPTRLIAPPMRSEHPLGSGVGVLATAGAFIGAILAFLGFILVRTLRTRVG